MYIIDNNIKNMRVLIGITGASGAIFAVECIKNFPYDLYLVASRMGKYLLHSETKISYQELETYVKKSFSNEDLTAPFASGSNYVDAMVIIPCSTSTVSKIACGISDSLLTRAASVAIKEGHKLILCIRETPLSPIVLENILKLSKIGVIIMPIIPAFYRATDSIRILAEDFSKRIIKLISHQDDQGWKMETL